MGEANFYYFTCLNYLTVILLFDTKTIMSSRGGRGGGGGRGNKRSSKGGRRHFTNPDELKAQADKEEKRKAWRRQQGLESESSEEEEEEEAPTETKTKAKKEHGAPGELPPSSSEDESEEESSEEEDDKPKGVSHLIAIENPNRVKQTTKKVTAVEGEVDKTQLSRREREEIEKQEARARYMKKHLAGETQEAQADLARLAIIRQRREEAAAKKAAAAEAAAAAADKK